MQADANRQVGYADFYLPPKTVGYPVLGAVATKDSVGVLAENDSNQGVDTRRGAIAAYRQLVFKESEYRFGLSYQGEESRPDGGEWALSRALAPVAELTWRRVDDVLNPKRGGVLNVRLAGGSKSVLSDQDFLKTYAQYQCLLVRIVLFPIGKIRDEILAYFASHVLAGIGIESLPGADLAKVNQADGEQFRRFSFISACRAW